MPAWKDSKHPRHREAVENLFNERKLIYLALNSPYTDIRQIAINRLHDEKTLQAVAANDSYWENRAIAFDKLRMPLESAFLHAIFDNSADEKYIGSINDSELLRVIVKESRSVYNKIMAAAKLGDVDVLRTLVGKSESDDTTGPDNNATSRYWALFNLRHLNLDDPRLLEPFLEDSWWKIRAHVNRKLGNEDEAVFIRHMYDFESLKEVEGFLDRAGATDKFNQIVMRWADKPWVETILHRVDDETVLLKILAVGTQQAKEGVIEKASPAVLQRICKEEGDLFYRVLAAAKLGDQEALRALASIPDQDNRRYIAVAESVSLEMLEPFLEDCSWQIRALVNKRLGNEDECEFIERMNDSGAWWNLTPFVEKISNSDNTDKINQVAMKFAHCKEISALVPKVTNKEALAKIIAENREAALVITDQDVLLDCTLNEDLPWEHRMMLLQRIKKPEYLRRIAESQINIYLRNDAYQRLFDKENTVRLQREIALSDEYIDYSNYCDQNRKACKALWGDAGEVFSNLRFSWGASLKDRQRYAEEFITHFTANPEKYKDLVFRARQLITQPHEDAWGHEDEGPGGHNNDCHQDGHRHFDGGIGMEFPPYLEDDNTQGGTDS